MLEGHPVSAAKVITSTRVKDEFEGDESRCYSAVRVLEASRDRRDSLVRKGECLI